MNLGKRDDIEQDPLEVKDLSGNDGKDNSWRKVHSAAQQAVGRASSLVAPLSEPSASYYLFRRSHSDPLPLVGLVRYHPSYQGSYPSSPDRNQFTTQRQTP